MSLHTGRQLGLRALVCFMIVLAPGALLAGGRQEERGGLAAGEVEAFLGDWSVNLDFQGAKIPMTLRFLDVEGMVEAQLASSRGEQAIDNVTRGKQGLDMTAETSFGPVSISIWLEGEDLVGVFATATGGLEAPLSGVRGSGDSTTTEGSVLFGGGSPSTKITIGKASATIRYPESASSGTEIWTEGKDTDSILRFTGASAVRLRTDLRLRFGDAQIAPGNLAPNYPGVYSLWLRKSNDGWRLVFNQQGDVWGTQYDPAFDVASVAIESTTSSSASEELEWKLEAEGDEGLLTVAWRDHLWVAPFRIASD